MPLALLTTADFDAVVEFLDEPAVSYGETGGCSLAMDLYCSIYILPMTQQPQVESFLPLKSQWFHILLSLAGEDQHGYGIMQEVLERTTGKVRLWPATLYGSLKRLIEASLIKESRSRPAPELDDARRRYYRLTPLGRQVLDAECERLQDLVKAIRSKRMIVAQRG